MPGLLCVISRCVNILILSGHFTPACTSMNIISHYHMLYRCWPTIRLLLYNHLSRVHQPHILCQVCLLQNSQVQNQMRLNDVCRDANLVWRHFDKALWRSQKHKMTPGEQSASVAQQIISAVLDRTNKSSLHVNSTSRMVNWSYKCYCAAGFRENWCFS